MRCGAVSVVRCGESCEVRCSAVRACEDSAGCASTVDYSESSVGTLLLLVRMVVGGVVGASKLVRRVACRRRCCT